jgi:hypothetical protein
MIVQFSFNLLLFLRFGGGGGGGGWTMTNISFRKQTNGESELKPV